MRTNMIEPQQPTTLLLSRRLLLFILTVLLVVVSLLVTFWVLNYQGKIRSWRLLQDDDKVQKQRVLSEQKAQETIAALDKLMKLPDEEPTVATVHDISGLKDLPFYELAEEGDRVIFYPLAQKAILFRPTLNKIIDIASLTVSESASNSASKSP